MTRPSRVLLPGTIIDERFQLGTLLGRGGMATVYTALDMEQDSQVALKLLSPEAAQHSGFRSRFLTEARTMSQLDHEHIARVWKYGADGEQLYFVMELATGGTLLDRIKRTEPTHPPDACLLIFQVLSGLSAAHRAGVVHRDVKPSNVLLTDSGAKLADFGIARLLRQQATHRTVTGDNLGTMGYMAPEQIADPRSVLPASDVYSVGATLFALLARRNPSGLAQLARHPQLLDPIPEPLRPVLTRACAYSLRERYSTALDMAVDLAHAHDQLTAPLGTRPAADQWLRSMDTSSNELARSPSPPSAPPRRRSGVASLDPSSSRPVPAPAPPQRGPAPWAVVVLVGALLFFAAALTLASWIVLASL